MTAELRNEIALVTGAGRGVGRAIAEGLARSGAAVALVSRTGPELDRAVEAITGAGGRAVAVTADVTDAAAVVAAVAATRDAFGDPTLVVNNAGVAHAIGPVADVDPELWWHDVRTSLFGSFLVAQAVLPAMLSRRAGRLVNVASYLGIRPSPHLSAYGAAKAALINFTESVAAETAASGIKVFAVSPGLVRTSMIRHFLESEEGKQWLPHVRDSQPLAPEASARLVCGIASGTYDGLSGTFLHVLDDVDELARNAEEIVAGERYVPRLRR